MVDTHTNSSKPPLKLKEVVIRDTYTLPTYISRGSD